MAWPLLFSHKKRHYLTFYFNRDEGKAGEEREKIAKDALTAQKVSHWFDQ